MRCIESAQLCHIGLMFRLRALLPLCAGACLLAAATLPNSKHAIGTHAKTRGPRVNPIAAQWMRSLSLRDRIAQLIVVPCYAEMINTHSDAYLKYRHEVRDLHVGGMIVLGHVIYGSVHKANPYAMAVFFNKMQRLAKVPLLVGGDFERGASMRVNDTTPWPYNMAFGAARDLEDARYEGELTAREARALGVQWIFAPDADVNSNPDNPIINVRSYGENPVEVSNFVQAYIRGAHEDPKAPVLVTAKHFPGHGDTAQDSHMELARLDASKEQMDRIELPPFRAAIEAGVDAIMTAHMTVPAYDPLPEPATVSRQILTDLLRDQLNFRGIVVTDAMDMLGLAKLYSPGEAAIRSIEAGADVLLMPPDPEAAIKAILLAIHDGRITRKRIDASVMKVLTAKARVGLRRQRYVDIDKIADVMDDPDAQQRAQQIADRAVTLVKQDQPLLPLSSPATTCVQVLIEGRYSQEGRYLMRELQHLAPGLKMHLLDPAMPPEEFDRAKQEAASCSVDVVAAFVTVAAYRGNVALPGQFPDFVNALVTAKAPVILVSLGSPYLARYFPKVAAYLATFSTTSTSEIAAAKALVGAIPIGGKLPVTIPGIAKYGDGIMVAAAQKGPTQ